MRVYTHLCHILAYSRRVRHGSFQTSVPPEAVYESHRNSDFLLLTLF